MSGLAVHVHRITVHGKILAGEKLANRELFAKIFLANTPKMYLVYALTVAYVFSKIFLANNSYLYGLPKFLPTKYFPCMVFVISTTSVEYCLV